MRPEQVNKWPNSMTYDDDDDGLNKNCICCYCLLVEQIFINTSTWFWYLLPHPRIRTPLVTNIITVPQAVLVFNSKSKRMSLTFPLNEFPVSNKNPLSNSTKHICQRYNSWACPIQFTISTSVSITSILISGLSSDHSHSHKNTRALIFSIWNTSQFHWNFLGLTVPNTITRTNHEVTSFLTSEIVVQDNFLPKPYESK